MKRSDHDHAMIHAAGRRAAVKVRTKHGTEADATLIAWRTKKARNKARVEFRSTKASATIDYRDVLSVNAEGSDDASATS